MTLRITMSLACALTIVPLMAFAQNSGTQAEQDACTPDVFSLCQDLIPNEGPIVACLQAKRAQLSPACSAVMFPQTRATTRRGARPRRHRAHHK